MYIMTTAPLILHFLHGCNLQLHIQHMIIGCKLATTEYGAEAFSQSQLVPPEVMWSGKQTCPL